MCNQFNKRFKKTFENHAWQQYFEEFKRVNLFMILRKDIIMKLEELISIQN